ncbi:MAG TPA: anion transporter [Acidaminococcaceae bacterium]|nr:anion transporter [Acidaminococcaceae bacterium]
MRFELPIQSVKLRKEIRSILKRDIVLTVSLLLALVSSLFFKPTPAYIDFPVLGMLLSFMLVVAGFRKLQVLEKAASFLFVHCSTTRHVAAVLVGLPFFTSMLVTNDVSLLIFVPLALITGKQLKLDVGRIVIFQTLAANLGSACTPMGNPQNLFIYYHYQLTTSYFFSVLGPLSVLSALWLAILVHGLPNRRLQLEHSETETGPRSRILVFSGLLLLCFLSVLHVISPLVCTAAVVAVVAAVDRSLLKQADYSLLLTFIGFFIFIGNLSHWDAIRQLHQYLHHARGIVYLAGIVASQFISNVPAAMLLAGFTRNAGELLLGVDVGGLGTLIASMASVISYKLYANAYPHQVMNYLRMFLFYNFAGLIGIGGIVYWWMVR